MNLRIQTRRLAVFAAIALLAIEAASAPAASPLPVIFLEAKETIVPDRKVPCTVRMDLPPGIPGDPVAASGAVRIHGATSQGYPKKSYALTLETPMP